MVSVSPLHKSKFVLDSNCQTCGGFTNCVTAEEIIICDVLHSKHQGIVNEQFINNSYLNIQYDLEESHT